MDNAERFVWGIIFTLALALIVISSYFLGQSIQSHEMTQQCEYEHIMLVSDGNSVRMYSCQPMPSVTP